MEVWPEKKVRTPVPSRPMRARARAYVDGVGPAAAQGRRHRHAEDVVLARQRQHLIVEAMLDVAEFLDGADFLAERLDVVQQPLLIGRNHVGTSLARSEETGIVSVAGTGQQGQVWVLPGATEGGLR